MQNLRVKYYKEGDWISEMKLAQGRSEVFYEDCFQLHCYLQRYEKIVVVFFFYIVSYFYLSDGEELKDTYLFS